MKNSPNKAGNQDSTFMSRALQLAGKAYGKTWPNPMVGAVVVHSGRIVGEGFHHGAGMPHAEVEALDQAGKAAGGADLYVTLEPCHLTGRTGPCTKRIMVAGIKRVIVGTRDPNPNESGRGLAKLRKAGIDLVEHVQEKACRMLNEEYNIFIQKKRPFIHVKMASSLDGRTATCSGDSQWISSEESRNYVHKLRSQSDAVLVGAQTVRKDNPRLNVRHLAGKDPIVVILDTTLSLSPKNKLFSLDRDSPIWIYCGKRVPPLRAERLVSAGAEIIRVRSKNGLVDLEQVVDDLFKRNVFRLLVEGGATIFGAFLSKRLVDRVDLHMASCLLGSYGLPLANYRGSTSVSDAPRLEDIVWKKRGRDMCCTGVIQWPTQ